MLDIAQFVLNGCFSRFFLASSATLLNIRNARKHFEYLEKLEQPHSAIARCG